ncbi:MAG: GGDEF domain-containing protein [Geminicoccaceae bacterium]|nr:GGDEF domain-containing protein [Geminicoccaceae bacterium]
MSDSEDDSPTIADAEGAVDRPPRACCLDREDDREDGQENADRSDGCRPEPASHAPLTSRSLAEQLRITEHDLDARKKLFLLDDRDTRILREARQRLKPHVDEVVDRFYKHQLSVPRVDLIIGDSDTLARLRSVLRRYVNEIFEGIFDIAYVNSRLRIGKIHHRLNVAPRLYIAAVFHLEMMICDVISREFGPDRDGATAVQRSVHKVLMFDTQLIFDTFINGFVGEIKEARDAAETHAIQLKEMLSARTAQLEAASRKDPLTGLGNPRMLREVLRREVIRSERYSRPLSVVFIDLDGFKTINDRHGHHAGDRLLRQLAGIMQSQSRDCDTACRYGGDEFVLIMPETRAAGAQQMLERMGGRLRQTFDLAVRVSAGIVEYAGYPKMTIDDLLARADRSMYAAKRRSKENGDDDVIVWCEIHPS